MYTSALKSFPERSGRLGSAAALTRLDTRHLLYQKVDGELTKVLAKYRRRRTLSSCRIHLPAWLAESIRKHESDGLYLRSPQQLSKIEVYQISDSLTQINQDYPRYRRV